MSVEQKDPYLVVGGYHIGDDVLVLIDGQLVSGRVQGSEANIWVQIMMANGFSYMALPDQVSAVQS